MKMKIENSICRCKINFPNFFETNLKEDIKVEFFFEKKIFFWKKNFSGQVTKFLGPTKNGHLTMDFPIWPNFWIFDLENFFDKNSGEAKTLFLGLFGSESLILSSRSFYLISR